MSNDRYVNLLHIAASPERVWEALTEPEFLKRFWFGRDVRIGKAVGEPFEIWHDGEQTDAGEILAYDPPRTLAYSFRNLSMDEPFSRVTFTVEPNGDGTKLRLIHDQFVSESKVLPAVRGGWTAILSSMKSLLEGADPNFSEAFAEVRKLGPVVDPDPVIATTYRTYIAAPAERIWGALTDPEITAKFFFGSRIESTFVSGAPVRILSSDGKPSVTGIVLRAEPPRFLSYTWKVENMPDLQELPACWVEFEIDAFGESSRLTLREFHAEVLPEWLLEGGRNGWPAILSNLKTLLETGRPLGRVEVAPPKRPTI